MHALKPAPLVARSRFGVAAARATCLAALAAAGCQGRIGGGGGSATAMGGSGGSGGNAGPPAASDAGTSDDGNAPPASACTTGDMLPIAVPLQRINDTQWNAIIAQLFGDKIASTAPFPPPSTAYPYRTYSAANPTGEGEAQAILEAAEAVAMQVVDTVPPCTGDETQCAAAYLGDLTTRAFRRAPTADELALVTGAYARARPSMTYAEGVGVGVETILEMPQFLYLLEEQPSAPTDAPIPLTGAEIAQRMALLYWNGLPDDALLRAGTSGDLATGAGRLAQAQRMLDDPRARPALEGFLTQWLTLQGFADTLHAPDVDAALTESLRRDVDDAIDAPDGVSALLTSSHTWVDSTLETFYGLPAKSAGPDDWRAVDLDPNQRVGLLTNPRLLTRDAHGPDAPSPILRGKFVRVMLMCDTIPAPPPNAQALQSTLTPAGATIREQSQARLDNAACGPCHKQMDPIGFGFSAFDGLGRYAPTAGGQPVDVSGFVQSDSDLGGAFNGVRDLGEKLAKSPKAEACLATQWMRYAFGAPETSADACQLQALTARFAGGGHSLKSLFGALSALDGFAARSATEGN
jgi:hypothetical protein